MVPDSLDGQPRYEMGNLDEHLHLPASFTGRPFTGRLGPNTDPPTWKLHRQA